VKSDGGADGILTPFCFFRRVEQSESGRCSGGARGGAKAAPQKSHERAVCKHCAEVGTQHEHQEREMFRGVGQFAVAWANQVRDEQARGLDKQQNPHTRQEARNPNSHARHTPKDTSQQRLTRPSFATPPKYRQLHLNRSPQPRLTTAHLRRAEGLFWSKVMQNWGGGRGRGRGQNQLAPSPTGNLQG